MRLKRIKHDFEKYRNYENEQKLVLDSIISRLNKIGEFFDVVVKLEKFMIEEVREEYSRLIEVRNKKDAIVGEEGLEKYISKYFVPAVDALNNKIEASIKNWNYVEREHTTGKVYGFISAMKNFYKELNAVDKEDEEEEGLHQSSIPQLIKEILDSFGNFKMYRAVMSEDVVERLQILLSMQKDILDFQENPTVEKKVTLDDL